MGFVIRRLSLSFFSGVVIYLSLFYQLGNLSFVGADEPRYARIGEEMNLRNNYVTPTLNFRPWLEKPPLLFWLEALSYKCLGVSEFSARLPVAVLATFTVLVIGWFALALSGWRVAHLTVLILPTSGLFFVYGRAASTDVPLVAMLSLSLVTAFQATRSQRTGWLAVAGAALALAVLAKGPVAIALFCGIFLVYCGLLRICPWTWRQILAGCAVFALLVTPWFWQVWRENGYNFIASFWLNHHLARFLTPIHHHCQPPWYYLAVLIVGFFPWVFFLGSALTRLWRWRYRLLGQQERYRLFLWLWVAVPILFFSLGESKLPGYILPVFPALSVLTALEWKAFLGREREVSRVMRFQLIIFCCFTVLVLVVLVVGFHIVYRGLAIGSLLALPLLVSSLWVLREYRVGQHRSLFLSLVVGMTLFAVLAFWKAAPLIDDYHSAGDVCGLVRCRVSPQQPLILYRYFHHTAHYYTSYCATKESVPDLAALQFYLSSHPQTEYYLLTQEPGWRDLQMKFNPKLVRHSGNLYLAQIMAGRKNR